MKKILSIFAALFCMACCYAVPPPAMNAAKQQTTEMPASTAGTALSFATLLPSDCPMVIPLQTYACKVSLYCQTQVTMRDLPPDPGRQSTFINTNRSAKTTLQVTATNFGPAPPDIGMALTKCVNDKEVIPLE